MVLRRLVGQGYNDFWIEEDIQSDPEADSTSKTNSLTLANRGVVSEDDELGTTKGLIFSQCIIIETLGTLASGQDLLKLKQLSTLFYKILCPIYFNVVGKTIEFRDWGLDNLGFNPKPVWISNNYCSKNYAYHDHFPAFTWSQDITHIFRKIKLVNLIDDPNFNIGGLHINSIISQLRPYITVLELTSSNLGPICLSKTTNLYNFVEQFHKLKQLDINFGEVGDIESIANLSFSLDELELVFQSLSHNTRINLLVDEHCCISIRIQILERFGRNDSIRIIVKLGIIHKDLHDDFKFLTNRYGNLTNVTFRIDFWFDKFFVPISELISTASLVFKLKDQVKELSIILFEFPDLNSIDEQSVKQCLAQLSPIITTLRVSSPGHWNLFTTGCTWSTLRYLEIEDFKHPLEVFKGSQFPELTCLKLDVDHDLCIFHNSHQSDRDFLIEYFGNLPKLEKLVLDHNVNSGMSRRILPGSQLEAELKEILQIPEFHNHTFDGNRKLLEHISNDN